MSGFDVFSCAINNISKVVDKAKDNWTKEYKKNPNISYYFFHQANNMIINHVIKKMKIENKKVPKNIHNYGNTSGVSIPLLLATECNGNNLKNKDILLCGFGVGLSCSVIITNSIDLISTRIIQS